MKTRGDFNLSDWLDHLENRYEQPIQLGLSRVQQVAKSLGLGALPAKIISVAGTNGKGSTVATLEAIYHAAGYQVASYTSPHLLTFNERIRINQKPISDEDLCLAFSVIEQGRAETALSYFEMTTLAALWYFKQHPLDLIILEVGLGGRLDATNIIDSDLAIITTIDFDHQEYLGHTREAIGYEKAGILRPNKPFIFADEAPPATVINQALALKTQAYFYKRDYSYRLVDEMIEFHFPSLQMKLPKPSLHPNSVAAAVLASVLMQDALPLTKHHWEQALNTVFLAGRLEVTGASIRTLFDVSHNPQAALHLAQFIRHFHPKGAVHAVFSALKDKDIQGLVSALDTEVDHWYPALLTGKRAASREQLLQVFSQCGNLICYNTPLLAYEAASAQASINDLIVVYGSFNTVGEVMTRYKRLTNCEFKA